MLRAIGSLFPKPPRLIHFILMAWEKTHLVREYLVVSLTAEEWKENCGDSRNRVRKEKGGEGGRELRSPWLYPEVETKRTGTKV